MPSSDTHTPFVYADAWRRFAAQAIDGVVFIPLNILLTFFLAKQYLLQNTIFLGAMAIYCIVFLYSRWQATLGQRVMKIYMVTKEGKKPSFMRVVFRYMMYIAPGLPGFIPSFYIMLLSKEELAAKVNAQHYQYIHELAFTFYAVIAIILIAVAVLLLIWYVPVLFTKEKKSVPDMVCGTRIVKGRAGTGSL